MGSNVQNAAFAQVEAAFLYSLFLSTSAGEILLSFFETGMHIAEPTAKT